MVLDVTLSDPYDWLKGRKKLPLIPESIMSSQKQFHAPNRGEIVFSAPRF